MQTIWVKLTRAKSYDRGVRGHLINEWKLRVILFLSVIVGRKIVDDLELRIAKGVIITRWFLVTLKKNWVENIWLANGD
jgi:hypothetical protein